MAAEYSRELELKSFPGNVGSHSWIPSGGTRWVRDATHDDISGRSQTAHLKDGERKAIQTDRTVLVPGPKREVECVRTIFTLAAAGKTPKEIAKELSFDVC